MSGKDRYTGSSGAMGRIMDKIKRTVSTDVDDTRDPLHRGYSRVETGESSLSNSSTSTSLDTVIVERELAPLRGHRGASPSARQRNFSPILEGTDDGTATQYQSVVNIDNTGIDNRSDGGGGGGGGGGDGRSIIGGLDEKNGNIGGGGPDSKSSTITISDTPHKSSKSSLKASKVVFKSDQFSSDEDSFEERRDHFQKRKATSTAASDHKGILKDLKHILASDDRKAFQSKKHVSLDIRNTKVLEKILNGSSSGSEEEFENNRKDFQSRKHKSLDARVKFNLDKDKGEKSTSSSEDDSNTEGNRLLYKRVHDFSKPVIFDFKEFDVSDDDDFIAARKSFQQQRQISTDSRKSHRFFEMDDMGRKKNENIRTAVPFVRQITEDGKPKLEVYRPTTNPIYIYTQVLAALSVSIGSMVVGFSSGYTSPALPSMKNPNITNFEVSVEAGSWIGGMMPLVGLVGGIAGGPMIEYLGRRTTILATAIPFVISWLLIACATNIIMVLSGRAISGFCVGIASLSLPVYLGETLQPEVRGTLGLLPTVLGNSGILLSFIAGRYMNWSNLAFLGGTLPIPFLLLMLLIPETPRWFVSHGKDERARAALQWLRGPQADVEPELKGIIKTHTEAERHATGNIMVELLKNIKPLSISLGLMFSQQFSGINAVIFYAGDIFGFAGTAVEESISVIIIGIVNFIAIFFATLLIDRLGRKMLLYISSVSMIITLALLGGYFIAKDSNADVSGVSWLPLFSLMVYVLGFSLGFGPIPWLMMGEILPAKIRGKAASVATAFNWTCTFIVTKTFANMITAFGLGGAFLFYGAICIGALIFVILCVPETQGKSLEDIERKMMGRVRRMSSVANIRPLSFNM